METREVLTFDISPSKLFKELNTEDIRYPLLRELFKLESGRDTSSSHGKLDLLSIKNDIQRHKENLELKGRPGPGLVANMSDSRKRAEGIFLELAENKYATTKGKITEFVNVFSRLLNEFSLIGTDDSVLKGVSKEFEFCILSYTVHPSFISVSLTISHSLSDVKHEYLTRVYNFV